MMSILFTALAIGSVFEILPSNASPISEIRRAAPKPDEVFMQMANLVNSAPEIMCAIADLEPEKIAQMMPHLKELTRILKGNPLGELFKYLENLCAYHKELQQIKQVQQHINQFVHQNAGQAPITIKQKTKIKLVYAPQYGSSEDSTRGSPDVREFAKEVAANKMRIGQEAVEDLQKLKNIAKEKQMQLSQEIAQGNESLREQLREAQEGTKKEMTDAISLIEAQKQKAYDDMSKAIDWLRQQMQQQMEGFNTELEEKKKQYQNNVNELASNIRMSLDQENQHVEEQVSEATKHLQNRVANVNTQLGDQLVQARSEMKDEVEKATKEIEAEVQDIRVKMQEAMQDLRKDLASVDADMKQTVTQAYNGAKTLAMNTQSQAEVEKTIKEMRKATEDMRHEMENQIQKAIQELSADIKSILTAMRQAKKIGENATTAAGNIQDSPVGKAAAKNLSEDNMIDFISNNINNGGVVKQDAKPTHATLDRIPSGGLESYLNGQTNESHTHNEDFEDEFDGEFEGDGEFDEIED